MSDKMKDANAEMLKRFERDDDLMWPTPKARENNRQIYTDYLHKLVDNPTFIAALRMTEKTIAKAKAKHVTKTRITTNVLRAMIIALFAGATIGEYNAITKHEVVADSLPARSLMYTFVFGVMMLAAIPLWSITNDGWRNKEADEKPEVFYNRVIVRYFDVLKKMHPEMSDKYLQICNQPDMEMARAIYSLLIVNMDAKDVKKLNEIALSVNWKMYENQMDTMRDIENKINQATQIIEKTLNAHPELQSALVDAYAAKVPTTFFIVNANNQGRAR